MTNNDQLLDRAYNFGINEQAMISCAAGMSSQGYTVYLHTIAAFLIERAYEQIKLNCSYNQYKLILVSANGPFDYEKLGPTHFCANDVPLLSLLENINIFLPSCSSQVDRALSISHSSPESSYIRLTSRSSSEELMEIEENLFAHSKNAERQKCIIALGEAMAYVSERRLWEDYDIFQPLNLELNIENVVQTYEEVVFLEPYSRSTYNNFFKDSKYVFLTFQNQFQKTIQHNKGWDDFDKYFQERNRD